MKKRFALVALPLAFAGLGACSTYGYGYDDYGYSGSGYGDYGYNTGYGYGGSNYGYGGAYGGDIWHDAFYDDHYGPVHGGYWDLDGFFWYQSLLNGPYIRDHNRHFRRDYWNGGKHYRYADRRDNHGRDWNDRDRDRNNTYPPLFAGQQGGHRDGNHNRSNNNNWNGGRNDNDRNRNNDRNNDRSRNDDRTRNEGGNRYNPPPLFGGQQGQRANPAPPPSDPQLDGAPRGRGNDRDRNRDRSDNNDRGRGDGGARNNDRNGDRSPPPLFNGQQPQRQEPPPQRANPTPPTQPAPQAQPRPRNNDDDGDDSHRGRGRGGDRTDRNGSDRHDKD